MDNAVLAKPGAGLPFHEWLIARYLIIPSAMKSTSSEQAIELFSTESGTIRDLISNLSPDRLNVRRLIRRLQGLEDSSRSWSVTMALQHLVIVNRQIQKTMIALSEGNTDLRTVGIADLKPSADAQAEVTLSEFEDMTASFCRTAGSTDLDRHPESKYPHPWFGPMNAKEWLVMAALHQRIHRRQIEEIIKKLSAN